MTTKQMLVQLPENLREKIASNAGLVLKAFDPAQPLDAEQIRENILFATSGGVRTTCIYTYSDFGSDIDGCPKNTMEMMEYESAEAKMEGTALSVTADGLKTLLGAADVAAGGDGLSEITPRAEVKYGEGGDFTTIWHVMPYGTQGGYIATKLYNAMNTGGYSLQTEDKGKGKFAFSFTGGASIDNPSEIPFKVYLRESATAATANVDPETTEA